MLSKKSKYAIKALTCLAKRYESKTLLKIATISEEEKIPKKFLEAILVELRNNGLLHIKKTENAAFQLTTLFRCSVSSQALGQLPIGAWKSRKVQSKSIP